MSNEEIPSQSMVIIADNLEEITKEDFQEISSENINQPADAPAENDGIAKIETVEAKPNSESVQNSIEGLYDVIIIGAGASGLSAAYNLKKKKKSLKILILEAKNRVGGRTHTIELKCTEDGQKTKWDIGGQWVTDTQTSVTKLLKELNIETYRQFDTGRKVLETKGKVVFYNSTIPNISILSLFDLQLIIAKYNSNAKKVSCLRPFENYEFAAKMDSMNLENLLFSSSFSSTSRSIIEAATRTIYGLELNQINALFGLMYVNSGGGNVENLALSETGCAQEKKIKGGAQQISEKMLEFALSHSDQDKILFNMALKEVNQTNNEFVSVIAEATNTGVMTEFKAKKVISSIPLNQYQHIKFNPELPEHKRNVFKFSQMGTLNKFVVTYKTPFWRSKGFSGEVVSDGSILHKAKSEYNESISCGPIAVVFDGTADEKYGALVGFIGAKVAVEWSEQDAETRKAEVVEALVRYFGPEARDYLDYVEKNWSAEPFSGGCPVVNVTCGSVMKDYVRATREPYKNMHMCGTETAVHWQGYIDGAVESGERAANEVLFDLFREDKSVYEYEKTYYYQKQN